MDNTEVAETTTKSFPIDDRTLRAHYAWLGAERARDALAIKGLGFAGEALALSKVDTVCASLREEISVSGPNGGHRGGV